MASPKMQTCMLSILVAFLCICVSVYGEYANFEKIELPAGVKGPGGLVFRTPKDDPGRSINEGPYVTTHDGRIMEWNSTSTSFVDMAYTSPNWTKELCEGVDDPDMWSTCGLPLAITYDNIKDMFYIADAYRGLLSAIPRDWIVDPNIPIIVGPPNFDDNLHRAGVVLGGFKFANDVDVDPIGGAGTIYISDASLTYDVRDAIQPGFIPDASGKSITYWLGGKEESVYISGLRGGGGPAISSDGQFILISEFGSYKIWKHWRAGPKVHTHEVLLELDGNPQKITRAEKEGEFWVAITRIEYIPPTATIIPEGVRFDSTGHVLEKVQFGKEYPGDPIGMVLEHKGKLYVGSHYTNFVGVYSK